MITIISTLDESIGVFGIIIILLETYNWHQFADLENLEWRCLECIQKSVMVCRWLRQGTMHADEQRGTNGYQSAFLLQSKVIRKHCTVCKFIGK